MEFRVGQLALGVQEYNPSQGRRGQQETLIAEEMIFSSWLSPFVGFKPSATQLETKPRFRHTC